MPPPYMLKTFVALRNLRVFELVRPDEPPLLVRGEMYFDVALLETIATIDGRENPVDVGERVLTLALRRYAGRVCDLKDQPVITERDTVIPLRF
jgi:hypothetical protein